MEFINLWRIGSGVAQSLGIRIGVFEFEYSHWIADEIAWVAHADWITHAGMLSACMDVFTDPGHAQVATADWHQATLLVAPALQHFPPYP